MVEVTTTEVDPSVMVSPASLIPPVVEVWRSAVVPALWRLSVVPRPCVVDPEPAPPCSVPGLPHANGTKQNSASPPRVMRSQGTATPRRRTCVRCLVTYIRARVPYERMEGWSTNQSQSCAATPLDCSATFNIGTLPISVRCAYTD